MKRSYYFVISLLLHTLVFISVSFKTSQELELNKKSGLGNGGNNTQNTNSYEIIDIDIASGDLNKKKELINYFWGIGVTVNQKIRFINNESLFVIEVIQTHSGYCAETNGIAPGDSIFKINGLAITNNNDLIGDGPTKITLTILKRSGNIVNVTFNRCKVYY